MQNNICNLTETEKFLFQSTQNITIITQGNDNDNISKNDNINNNKSILTEIDINYIKMNENILKFNNMKINLMIKKINFYIHSDIIEISLINENQEDKIKISGIINKEIFKNYLVIGDFLKLKNFSVWRRLDKEKNCKNIFINICKENLI